MHEAEVAIPTETELNTFFDRLAESSTTVALLSTVPKYSDRFMNIPVPEPNLPPVLSSLYDEKHRNLTESATPNRYAKSSLVRFSLNFIRHRSSSSFNKSFMDFFINGAGGQTRL